MPTLFDICEMKRTSACASNSARTLASWAQMSTGCVKTSLSFSSLSTPPRLDKPKETCNKKLFQPNFDQLKLRTVTREIFEQLEWVNWRENTIQILASIRPEDKEQFEKADEQKTNEDILLEAELLTPPDVILKQVIKEEFTEWGEWSECNCGEKERIQINSNY